MIEVQILIALALIGTLLVLVRISLTLKGILEAMTAKPDTDSPSAEGAYRSAVGGTSGKPLPHGAKPAPSDDSSAPETLQDIAAVVAIDHRAMRQGSSKISQ
jgi:hypothetical protein